MARPYRTRSKFTPDRVKIIIEALEKHQYLDTACALAGISTETYYNWLDKAEAYNNNNKDNNARNIGNKQLDQEATSYLQFLESVKHAQARSESGLLGRIDEAGSVATMIEQKTTTRTLKDGSQTVEQVERWKPPDWQANAWILERTKYAKYGQHSSLDIQQAGVVFIERLQKARAAQVVEGEFREIDQLASLPKPEEIPAERPLIAGKEHHQVTSVAFDQSKPRPIFELIASAKLRNQEAASQKCSYATYNPADQPAHSDQVEQVDPDAIMQDSTDSASQANLRGDVVSEDGLGRKRVGGGERHLPTEKIKNKKE